MKFSISAHRTAFVCMLLLVILCISWEWFLAPLRPGGSWLVLKAIPIALTLRGLYRSDNYTMQASSMLILLYLAEGLVRWMDPWPNLILSIIEITLCMIIFMSLLSHLRPLKKAAKAKKQD